MGFFGRVYGALAKYRGAVELGWYDFMMGYRRSLLGPFWIMVQFGVWLAALTLILHRQLGDSPASYAIYVAVGMAVWEPLAGAMLDGSRHITQHAQLIKSVPVTLNYIAVRKLAFLLFRACLTVPVVVALLAIFGAPPDPATLILIVPAGLLVMLTMYAIIVVFGFIGAYNRDFEFFLPAVTRFLFFVTPIFWSATEGAQRTISLFNPFTYYLAIVRGPLLGVAPSTLQWGVVIALTLLGLITAVIVHANFRKSVIYWI